MPLLRDAEVKPFEDVSSKGFYDEVTMLALSKKNNNVGVGVTEVAC